MLALYHIISAHTKGHRLLRSRVHVADDKPPVTRLLVERRLKDELGARRRRRRADVLPLPPDQTPVRIADPEAEDLRSDAPGHGRGNVRRRTFKFNCTEPFFVTGP